MTGDVAQCGRRLKLGTPERRQTIVNFRHCPYDGHGVDVRPYPGGFFVVSCERCGASWEMHNALIRRITAPDREAVRNAVNEALTATPRETPAPVVR